MNDFKGRWFLANGMRAVVEAYIEKAGLWQGRILKPAAEMEFVLFYWDENGKVVEACNDGRHNVHQFDLAQKTDKNEKLERMWRMEHKWKP